MQDCFLTQPAPRAHDRFAERVVVDHVAPHVDPNGALGTLPVKHVTRVAAADSALVQVFDAGHASFAEERRSKAPHY